MNMKRIKIKKIGWDNENNLVPCILLNKKLREDNNTEDKDVVRVCQKYVIDGQEVEKTAIASVFKIYKEFVSEQDICLINTELANRLQVSEEDYVYLKRDITESEYQRYMRDIAQNTMFGL